MSLAINNVNAYDCMAGMQKKHSSMVTLLPHRKGHRTCKLKLRNQ